MHRVQMISISVKFKYAGIVTAFIVDVDGIRRILYI